MRYVRPIGYKFLFAAAWLVAMPQRQAQAHHSATAFDQAHPVIVTGTVSSFQWTNPHTWLRMTVPNGSGGLDNWEIEGPAVMTLVRSGWRTGIVKPGDKVHVLLAPRRDGAHGGTFMRVTLDNGQQLDTGRL